MRAVQGDSTDIDDSMVQEALSGVLSPSAPDYTEGIEGAI